MHRRWLINRTNGEYVRSLARASSVSTVLARIMVNRGVKTPSDVRNFLTTGISGFSDPFDLPGMREAVERIIAAVKRNERVFVHGDYDADGLTATAIAVSVLRAIGLEVHYFVPNRLIHGYGFNPPSVTVAKKLGAGLIVTVDCGITSIEAIDHARREGIDVIITDHHEPLRRALSGDADSGGEEVPGEMRFVLPAAVAVVNPKIGGCDPRTSLLSGAGIAFKLAQALARHGGFRFSGEDALSLLDLAVLGTVADIVPLIGENRNIVKAGLPLIDGASRPAITALKAAAGLDGRRRIKAGRLSFTLVPRLNAAGRVGDAGEVVRLLLSTSDHEAGELSAWLDQLNAERQRLEADVLEEAVRMVKDMDEEWCIVLAAEGWHQGVLGIVASRIAEEHFRPAFVLSVKGGVAKGSARSIPGFDLYEGLSRCQGLLRTFGGHRQAAGLTLDAGRIADFRREMSAVVKECLSAGDLVAALEIDADVGLGEVTHGLVREFEQLEPFGYGNPEPVLGAKALVAVDQRVVGSNHLKLRLRQGRCVLDAIGFDMGGLPERMDLDSPVDIAFTPSLNEWNGSRSLQLVLKGCRPSR